MSDDVVKNDAHQFVVEASIEDLDDFWHCEVGHREGQWIHGMFVRRKKEVIHNSSHSKAHSLHSNLKGWIGTPRLLHFGG